MASGTGHLMPDISSYSLLELALAGSLDFLDSLASDFASDFPFDFASDFASAFASAFSFFSDEEEESPDEPLAGADDFFA